MQGPEGPFTALEHAVWRQSTEDSAAKALASARGQFILGRDARSAFFATLLLRLQTRADWDTSTMCTDGRELRYNPSFVHGLGAPALQGVLAHEVMHNALAHPFRRGHRDAVLWNIACDLAINPILRDARMVLPQGCLVPGEGQFQDLLPGKSAEEYFALLCRAREESPDQDPDGEAQSSDPGKCGQVIDPSANADAAEARLAESDWKIALVEARQAAARVGALPVGLGRAVEQVVHPAADWRDILRQFVAQAARNDYSWSRPNRRFIAQGLYLPGLQSEELGDVVIAVDTSGSIGEALLGVFAHETNALLAAYDCSVTVLYHDTDIQKVQIWKSADGPLILDPTGGGGTSHVCVFDWIDRADNAPACVICLTDLETVFPVSAPAVPVLWAVIGKPYTQAPFGQIVALAD